MDKKTKALIALMLSATVLLVVISIAVLSYTYRENRVANLNERDTLTFTGYGEVLAIPDIAQLSFTVRELNDDVSQARVAVSEKVSDIYNYLDKKAKIDDEDVKTITYSIHPKYEYEILAKKGTRKRVFKGYEVTHTTAITIRDLDAAAGILSAISDKGVENVSNLQFLVDPEKQRELQDDALVLSVKNAKERAKKVSKETGIRLGKVMSVNIGGGGASPYRNSSQYGAKSVSLESSSLDVADVPISVGENKITSYSSITYYILEE